MLNKHAWLFLNLFFFLSETTSPAEMEAEATADLSWNLNHFYVTRLFIMVVKTKGQFISSPSWNVLIKHPEKELKAFYFPQPNAGGNKHA